MGEHLYLLGAALLIVAVLLGRRPRSTFKARDISGSVVVNGDNTGNVNLTPHSSAPAAKPPADRVAWGIGIVGVLISAAQLIHDVMKP